MASVRSSTGKWTDISLPIIPHYPYVRWYEHTVSLDLLRPIPEHTYSLETIMPNSRENVVEKFKNLLTTTSQNNYSRY
jgi:hypothetical protein